MTDPAPTAWNNRPELWLGAGLLVHAFFLAALSGDALRPFFNDASHTQRGFDFAVFYLAGQALAEGRDIYAVEGAFGFRYLPAFALTAGRFFALFQPQTAYFLHLGITELFLAANLWLTWRVSDAPRRGPALFMWLAFSPYFLELYMGQVSFWAASLLFWLLAACQRGQGRWTGLYWAGAVLIKPNALILIPALVRLRALRMAVIGLGLALLSSLPYFLLYPEGLDSFIHSNTQGAHIKGALPHAGSRLARMSFAVGRTFRLALAARADLYHFHDPELIPAGLLLRFLGKQVIYDIHEDNFTAIREREYLPSWLRGLVARTFALAETGASRYFHLILAERYYAERFPRGTTILNYARFPELDETALAQRPRAENPRLIYTGNVKEYRGARCHAQLLQHLPNAEVFLVGRCDKDLAVDLQRTVDSTRLHFEGVGTYVPHERIVDYYLREYWTAGLALFPPSQHTSRKELTKIFEYMAYGIPVLCSNFPNLREIVEDAKCGLCVDSNNGAEAAEAVRYLWEHPDQVRQMGENGRESARTTYNWDTQAEKLLDFYAGIL